MYKNSIASQKLEEIPHNLLIFSKFYLKFSHTSLKIDSCYIIFLMHILLKIFLKFPQNWKLTTNITRITQCDY